MTCSRHLPGFEDSSRQAVPRDFYQDATLILVGHGSTRNDDSGATVRLHTAELQARGQFAEVRGAFWKQVPSIVDLVAEARTPRVFIVPLFVSEGYFAEQAIPEALGFPNLAGGPGSRVRENQGRRLYYARPVGTHDRMTEVILARAQEALAESSSEPVPAPSDTTLFVAGHGTKRDPKSRRAVERQADRIGAMRLFADVQAVFMEETPRIADCVGLSRTRGLVVVPFFMSDGLHVSEDIPVLLGEPAEGVRERLAAGKPTWRNPTERGGRLIWYARAVGTDPRLVEVILERVEEARGWG